MDEPEHVVSAREVYDHSAEQYVAAVGTVVSPRFETRLDLAVLDAFSDEIQSGEISSGASRTVIDIGCGTGRVTSYLAGRGLDIRGVDVSSAMIDAARSAHPELRFDVGSLTALGALDGSVLGAVYWYSIIATPPSGLRAVWAELDRVLTSDGRVLLAFQAGDNDRVERANAYGSSTTLTLLLHRVDDVARSLEASGFDVRADLRRQPELPHETTPQAFLLARRQRR